MDNKGIWYKVIARDEMINFVDRERSAPVLAVNAPDFGFLPLNSAGITAYWQEDPQRRPTLPNGVIVPSADLDDFFAWVATYLPIRPLTAYCRVLDPTVIQYFSNPTHLSFVPLENCFLGVILAESAKHVGTVERSTQLSLIDAAGTLSFCLTRAAALGMPGAANWIERQWKKLRLLMPDRSGNPNDTALVSRVFRLICALDNAWTGSDEDQVILNCAHDIVATGEIQQHNWLNLTNWNPQLSRSLEVRRLPRESRISLFRKVAESLLGSEKDQRAAFVVGYLGSAVAPGTFDHYRTVSEFESKLPGALLWYGFCAGLYKDSDLQFFSNGLGRRIARELERADSIYARPYCDVAISELEVLLRATKPPDFRLGTPGNIEVELAPCVTTVRPFASEQQTRRPENIDSLLRELDYKLQDLSRLRNKIARATSVSEQGDLYSEPSKSRRR